MAGSFGGPGSDLAARRVPPGMYFLLGDHRDVSYGSRFWGFAERRAIL
jgi:signal peptidase I